MLNRIEFLLKENKLPQSILICGKQYWNPIEKALFIASKLLKKDIKIDDFHPDFLLIDLEENRKNITIEQIRKIKEFCYLSTQIADNKVVIINNADFMSIEAANSILKILEEPVERRYFILITSNKHKILPTILSRCVIFSLKPDIEKDHALIKNEKFNELKEIFIKITEKNVSSYHLIDLFNRFAEELGDFKEFCSLSLLINNYIFDNIDGNFLRINIIKSFLNIIDILHYNINVKYIITLLALYLSEKKFEQGVLDFE